MSAYRHARDAPPPLSACSLQKPMLLNYDEQCPSRELCLVRLVPYLYLLSLAELALNSQESPRGGALFSPETRLRRTVIRAIRPTNLLGMR